MFRLVLLACMIFLASSCKTAGTKTKALTEVNARSITAAETQAFSDVVNSYYNSVLVIGEKPVQPAIIISTETLNEFSRRLTSESQLSIDDLIYPVFVIEGKKIREEIESMPGTFRLSIDELINEAKECYKLGIPAIALFPVIDDKIKTLDASESFNNDGLIPRTIKALKKAIPKLGIITDVALDPYTSHGQDG